MVIWFKSKKEFNYWVVGLAIFLIVGLLGRLMEMMGLSICDDFIIQLIIDIKDCNELFSTESAVLVFLAYLILGKYIIRYLILPNFPNLPTDPTDPTV